MEYLEAHVHPPLSNKKASNKKLDSQISYFNRISKDLITKSNKNLLLKIKKSRLSLEKNSFLMDRMECSKNNNNSTYYNKSDPNNSNTPPPIQ